jgi:hypothetical protein
MADPSDWNREIIDQLSPNDGKVGRRFEGAPTFLLTSTGVKTGGSHISQGKA